MPSPFSDLLIHPISVRQLDSFVDQPSHGLMISGVTGSGKHQAALALSAVLLGVPLDGLQKHPHFFVISKPADKSEISIDAARWLISKLNLKVPGERPINRIAIIQGAETMSNEAQNALLKLLEEPPAGSLIVLTTSSAGHLLPTVASRLQKLTILPVGLTRSLDYFDGLFPKSKIESAWQLSRGAAMLMTSILNDENEPIKLAVDDAKNLLKLDVYQRLIFLQKASKDKPEFELTLQALSRVLAALNHANVAAGRQKPSARLLEARKLVNQTQDSLDNNTNVRLAALSLALSMPI